MSNTAFISDTAAAQAVLRGVGSTSFDTSPAAAAALRELQDDARRTVRRGARVSQFFNS